MSDTAAAQCPSRKNRQGIPDLGPCLRCNLQIEGTGVITRGAVIIDGASDLRIGRPRRTAADLPQARGPAGRPRRRLRGSTTSPPCAGRSSTGSTSRRRTAAGSGTVKIVSGRRPITAPDASRPTTSLTQNCEGSARGDAGMYPGAAPETGAQATRVLPDSPDGSTRPSRRLRPARQRAGLLGVDGQRRADHAQRHLRQHRRHLHGHDLGRRPSRLPGGQRPDRPQPDLLQQPPAVQGQPAGAHRASGSCRSASGSSGRATTTAASSSTRSGTTGATARSCSRSPTSW